MEKEIKTDKENSLLELMKSRRSVRAFKPDPLSDEDLNDILEAGRIAPSSQNRQPWRYIVFTDQDEIRKLARHTGLLGLSNFFIKDAPCVIIACAEMKKNLNVNKKDYYLVDTAISFHQMILCAWEKGIGSCWMAAFSEKLLSRYLKIPKSWRIVAMSPFGYPEDEEGFYGKLLHKFSSGERRVPMEEIVKFWQTEDAKQ